MAGVDGRAAPAPGSSRSGCRWWSFTFPVGTCVTATTTLAVQTGSVVLRVAAAVWYAGLVAAWLTVALRTAHGTARGPLLLPPQAQPAHTAE